MESITGINDIPFPAVVIDCDIKILSHNFLFKNTFFNDKDETPHLLTDIFEEFKLEMGVQNTIINEKCYQIYTSKKEELYNVFFVEVISATTELAISGKVMVGLIMIDNYAEVQESIEDVRHPYLVAVIERKIGEYFNDLGGIVRKFENDKYVFVLCQNKLEQLKENKFSIIDIIGKIDMSNIPVTLSIGIGLTRDNNCLNESMEYARGALDLALGRGGNQVVIKEDEDNYQFIGGDGREVSSNSKVRARVKAYGLVELIQSASDVIIMGHKNPDLDCLGAASGVYAISYVLGIKCKIVLNEVTNSVKALYDRLMEDPKYENAFITGEEAIKSIKRRTLLIIVDTHKPSICESPELIEKAKKRVVFDHHRKGKEFVENVDLTYHEAFASSTCELITEMLMYVDKSVKLTKTEAEGLLAGITVDTKNFAFKTGIKTFEAAAYLKRYGADTIEVRRLFQNTLEDYTAKAEIVSSAKIYKDNMAIAVLNREVGCPVALIAQAADEMLNIAGIEVSYVLCKYNAQVFISARSLGKLNVQKLMEKLGGGGHQTGAAAQLEGVSVEEAIEILKKTIDEFMQEVN